MNTSLRLIGTASLCLLATAASAKVIASATYPQNFSFSTNPTYQPLNTSGITTLSVNAKKAGKYVLTYSAECSVNAPADNYSAWVEIDIEVNGTVVAPTVGTSDGFCGANGTLGFDHWQRSSITTVVTLVEGTNSVRIKGGYQAGATAGWLSDSALVIHD